VKRVKRKTILIIIFAVIVLIAFNLQVFGTEIQQDTVTVLPEVTTSVEMSNTDINRIVCPYTIKDVVFSKEKGITVKIHDRNAFVKFLVKQDISNKYIYTTTPSEFYVVCGKSIYNIIAIPKKIPARTILLGGQKEIDIQKNVSLFKEMPFERKIVEIIKQIYTEQIPDSYSIENENKKYAIYNNRTVNLRRVIDIEGEGLRVKEYTVTASTNNVELNEKDFLNPSYTKDTVAISIDKLILAVGETARVFIVERRLEGE